VLHFRFESAKYKPDKYDAWVNRGNAFLALGEYEDAIDSYDKALEYKPDKYDAWVNRGNALFKKDSDSAEEAIQSYKTALKYKPDGFYAYFNLGTNLGRLKRYEASVFYLGKAIKLKPEKADFWFNRACSYSLMGNVDKAIADLQKAVTLDPIFREEAKIDSCFDSVRYDQRFQQLLEKNDES
jgi:tetratricopeptide (TPR) repeat protein